MILVLATWAGNSGNFLGHWRWICLCLLQRWQSPLRLSSSFGFVDPRCVGIVYILLISMGLRGGVDTGVGVYTSMGEGDRCIASIQWAFREVRMAWRVHADFVHASQFWGLSWCIQGSRSSSGKPDLNFSSTAGSFL